MNDKLSAAQAEGSGKLPIYTVYIVVRCFLFKARRGTGAKADRRTDRPTGKAIIVCPLPLWRPNATFRAGFLFFEPFFFVITTSSAFLSTHARKHQFLPFLLSICLLFQIRRSRNGLRPYNLVFTPAKSRPITFFRDFLTPLKSSAFNTSSLSFCIQPSTISVIYPRTGFFPSRIFFHNRPKLNETEKRRRIEILGRKGMTSIFLFFSPATMGGESSKTRKTPLIILSHEC